MSLHNLIIQYCELDQLLSNIKEPGTTQVGEIREKMNLLLVDLKKLLKDNSSSVNAKNDAGEAPIHIAVRYNNERMVRFLRWYNANLEIENAANKTPFECALDLHDVSSVNNPQSPSNSPLQSPPSQIDQQRLLHEKIMNGPLCNLARLFVKWGVDIERKRNNGSLLHAAIREKKMTKAWLLLALGVDCLAYYDEELPPKVFKFGSVTRSMPNSRRITVFTLLQELELPREWWKLLMSYGAGICANWNREICAFATQNDLIRHQFLYRLTYTREIRGCNVANKSVDIFEQACFNAEDICKSMEQGVAHNLDAYLNVFNKFIRKGVTSDWIKHRDALIELRNLKMPLLPPLQKPTETVLPSELPIELQSAPGKVKSPGTLYSVVRHWIFQNPDKLDVAKISQETLDKLQDEEEIARRNVK